MKARFSMFGLLIEGGTVIYPSQEIHSVNDVAVENGNPDGVPGAGDHWNGSAGLGWHLASLL